MNDQGFPMGSYPVLLGVSPDVTSSVTSETSDITATHASFSAPTDSFGVEGSPHQPYGVRPLVSPLVSPLVISHLCRPPRQHNCYHSIVSRQWRIDEYETCNSCGRRPLLRWFYICTEDTTSYTDPVDPNGTLMSSWITEAILAGEYTDAQRETLIEQKLGVLRLCEQERSLSEIALARAQADASFGLHYENGHQGYPHIEADPYPSMSQIHPHPARCNYRACHHCDRKLQERTWLSLNEICNDPDIKPPSAWDLWETPVSDVNLVSNLGLRCPPAPVPPPHRSYVYRGSQRHRIQRVTGNYLVGHGSSLSLRTLMSTLSTIEEISEETELRQTEVRI